ncbi:uncharacterized protein I206_103602 [Kwoniella pini CBS 10737]|uniref:Uncharacterized protein n=1 Tax=Kwoniella pini CBS 10737 TaxID=1296096 RepID=A0A1B9I9E1_9TREE|nr:uncharacterized protein I206_01395 [Kwoniella pini CBS 10737]OCF52110.1 hypothetical protein I206_01395 [Kwoniella pini CBS 10737]
MTSFSSSKRPRTDDIDFIHPNRFQIVTTQHQKAQGISDDPFISSQFHALSECKALINQIDGKPYMIARIYTNQWERCLTALKASQLDYHSLLSSHGDLVKQLDIYQKEIIQLQAVLESKEEYNQLAKKEAIDWKKSHIKEKASCQQLKVTLDGLNDRVSEQRAEINDLQEQKANLDTKCEAVLNELSEALQGRSDLETKIREMEIEKAAIQDENKNLHETINQLENELRREKEEKNSPVDMVRDYQGDIDDLQEERGTLVVPLEKSEHLYTKVPWAQAELETQIETLKWRLSEANVIIDNLHAKQGGRKEISPAFSPTRPVNGHTRIPNGNAIPDHVSLNPIHSCDASTRRRMQAIEELNSNLRSHLDHQEKKHKEERRKLEEEMEEIYNELWDLKLRIAKS